jgi:hypothetical protein
MPALHPRRLAPLTALLLCLAPGLLALAAPPAKPQPKTADYDGKVVPLAGVLARLGAQLDPDAGRTALALVTDDGKTYPLVKDEGSRLFFKDDRLLNRRMRLTGRVLPEVGMLQVVRVHSYVNGKLCDLYYWCDVCSIRRGEKNKCDCCGGPLELHEDPVEK